MNVFAVTASTTSIILPLLLNNPISLTPRPSGLGVFPCKPAAPAPPSSAPRPRRTGRKQYLIYTEPAFPVLIYNPVIQR